MTQPPVLVERISLPRSADRSADKVILKLTLNSEATLNALTLPMIDALQVALSEAESDTTVQAVILQGSGRKAFCAGGDVVKLYRALTGEADPDFPLDFFSREYRLDYYIHTYPKPLICLAQGIVMGGGLGLMNGCSHRIVGEKTRLAMPEVSIGLFPDVGGSWFLNRLPGQLGLYLALTGAALNANDTLYLGMADRFVSEAYSAELIPRLQAESWTDDALVTVNRVLRELEELSQPARPPESPLRSHRDKLDVLLDHDHLQDLLVSLTRSGEPEDAWLRKGRETLERGSPLAIHCIYRQLQACRHASLAQVFQAELALAIGCGQAGDFREGVRALLIDKDLKPRWAYTDWRDVPESAVDACFTEPWDEHPLRGLGPGGKKGLGQG